MANCSRVRKTIFGSNGILDQESAAHCAQCPACRRELDAVLRGQLQTWQIPAEVEQQIFSGIAARPALQYRNYGRRIWIPAAAGLLILLAAAPVFQKSMPKVPAIPSRASFDAAWEGAELKLQLSLMDQALRAEEMFPGGGVE